MAVRKCRGCGCMEIRACEGGCFWWKPDLCSRCVDRDALSDVDRAAYDAIVKMMNEAMGNPAPAGSDAKAALLAASPTASIIDMEFPTDFVDLDFDGGHAND